jgi:hypothetical protein
MLNGACKICVTGMTELQRNVSKALPSIEWLIAQALRFYAVFFVAARIQKNFLVIDDNTNHANE